MFVRLSDIAQIEPLDAAPLPLAPRDAALLAWLALEGPTPRDQLAALLWPASTEAQARTTLRQRLFQLKRLLGTDIAVGTRLLRLADGVQHDLAEATELLGTLTLPDAPEFDAWLSAQRERRQRQEREGLQAQSLALEQAGDAAAALSVAGALLRLEPTSEAAHRRVMRLHYLLGERAAALQAFDRCERMLKDEVSTRPSAETLALLATIEASPSPTASAVSAPLPASVLRPPRMVGRERERAQLEAAWAAGHVAAVLGEAGMGKTRLLNELVQSNPGVVRAAGRPGDAGIPLATLARLLRAVGPMLAGGPLGEPLRLELARVLPEWGPAPVPLHDGQRLRLQRALHAFLQASGVTGLALDDLHFADEASLEMLQSLIADDAGDGDATGASPAGGMRWVLAFRPAETGAALLQLKQSLSELARWVPLSLEALDETALAELVDELALPGVRGAALAATLLQRTGGNPLYVLETLKQAWVELGPGALATGATLPQPRSVGQLIAARVSRLSREALALARVASIASVDFDIALAEQVLGMGAMHFADALSELESAQVLRGLQFAHDLVFEAVRGSVPPAIARHTHGAVAGWLEHHQGEPARIARHWIDGEQPEKALPWLEQAAVRARDALRNVEHLAFLDLRADIEHALGRQDDAFRTQLEAFQIHCDNERSEAVSGARLDALEALARSDEQRILVWLERASLGARRTDFASAETIARRALEAAQAAAATPLVQKCQTVLFELLTAADKVGEALAVGEACLGWIDGLDDDEMRRNFHGALACLYDNKGQLGPCLAHNEIARQICQRHHDTLNLGTILGNLATAHGRVGQLRQALALGLESLRVGAQFEHEPAGQAVAYLNLIEAGVLLGRYADALRWADLAEPLLADSAPGGVALARAHRALCWLYLGQRARVMPLLQSIEDDPAAVLPARVRLHLLRCRLAREQSRSALPHVEAGLALLAPGVRPDLHGLLVIEQALTRPPGEALALLDAVRERAEGAGAGGLTLEVSMRSAQVALAVDPALARQHALRALRQAEDFDPIASYVGELWLHAARAQLAAGEEVSGGALLARALAWVRQTAREQVAPEFRDGFRRRNPVNAALAALAAKQGLAAGDADAVLMLSQDDAIASGLQDH